MTQDVTALTQSRRIKGAVRCLVLGLILGLTACSTVVERQPAQTKPATPAAPRVPATADAVPRAEVPSKYGNPESYEVFGQRYYTLKTAAGYTERGIASWYGDKFHGRKTSSGEIYDMYQMTAAHKGLPLPSYVEVRNLDNGRTAVVKVNDRGPFHDNRIIDLSYAAALKLGLTEKGTGFVEVIALDANGKPAKRPASTVAARPPSAVEAEPPESRETRQVDDGVYLQVGAFQDLDNARRLAEKLDAVIAGQVHIREIAASSGVVHRVQVGPLASVDAADTIVGVLETLGISTHHFVAR